MQVTYAVSPQASNQAQQYQVAYATQPAASLSYAPALAVPTYAPPYTTATYSNGGQLSAASLQQGQIIPYTSAANGFYITPAQLQQLTFAAPQTGAATPAQAYQQIPSAYTTATPVLPGYQKLGSTVVAPTAAAYYSPASAAQNYHQQPSFRKQSPA